MLQGEREMATYNKSLGKFQLTGIPPAPRGVPQIEVTFDIDANGILNVSAPRTSAPARSRRSRSRPAPASPTQRSSGWCKDAEAHAEDDRRQRELAEARNTGENAAYQAERQLNELGDQVDASSKEEIEAAIKDVRDALESEDAAEIRTKTDALQEAFHKVSEQMYAAAAQASSPAGDGATASDERRRAPTRRRSSTPRSSTGSATSDRRAAEEPTSARPASDADRGAADREDRRRGQRSRRRGRSR